MRKINHDPFDIHWWRNMKGNPMTTAEIVPYRYYEDHASGRKFSLFTSWKPAGAVMVEKGFTIKWPDGTYGCGRPPFATIEEAKAYLAKVPKNFTGMHALGN